MADGNLTQFTNILNYDISFQTKSKATMKYGSLGMNFCRHPMENISNKLQCRRTERKISTLRITFKFIPTYQTACNVVIFWQDYATVSSEPFTTESNYQSIW